MKNLTFDSLGFGIINNPRCGMSSGILASFSTIGHAYHTYVRYMSRDTMKQHVVLLTLSKKLSEFFLFNPRAKPASTLRYRH